MVTVHLCICRAAEEAELSCRMEELEALEAAFVGLDGPPGPPLPPPPAGYGYHNWRSGQADLDRLRSRYPLFSFSFLAAYRMIACLAISLAYPLCQYPLQRVDCRLCSL